jgi:protein-tyrosine phosphatase
VTTTLPTRVGPGDGRLGGTPYRITVVCLGNICRSPTAAVVLEDRLRRAGLSGSVTVASAGTGAWHLGEPMDSRAATLLTERGYDASRHRARRFEADWLATSDLVLAMDAQNHADVSALGPSSQVRMFRDFDPVGPGDVPDPWFGGDDGFADVLAMVERTCAALVAHLDEQEGA